MGDTIAIGDEVRLRNGFVGTIKAMDRTRGLYLVNDMLFSRHEFTPVKWDGDVIGKTGIGCCAKNSSEEMA